MKQATLSKQEEDRLVEIIRIGQKSNATEKQKKDSLKAMEKLLIYLQPLVANIALKYTAGTIHQDELIRSGNIGIRKAILKYNPNRNFKFSTYASWYIRAEIHKKLGLPL